MRGRKLIGLLLTVVTLIFVVACLLFFQTNRDYRAQKGIEEAIKAYSATMEEQEIKVLTDEINDVVERKLGEIGRDTLSEEDMNELLSMIVKEVEKATMEYRDSDITQEEVYRIATRIVQNTWEEKAESLTKEQLEELEAWQKQLEALLTRQDNMDAYLAQIQSDFKAQLAQNQSNANNQVSNVSKELSDTAEKLTQLEGSVLFYEYDADTQTLKLYGK